ncbi:transposase, partial [Methylobacterium sp. E-045]|uniref:transposase n=1 Tax=Methylobacterium sp. E-045 TaxID=2836575 RepID=UPI001FBA2E2E
MATTRREFTPEFQREAVALLDSSGRPERQIAAELGIQPSMLRQWRTGLRGGSPPPRVAGSPGAAWSEGEATELADAAPGEP